MLAVLSIDQLHVHPKPLAAANPSTRCGGRRPKSAKARNRGKWGTGGAAGLWRYSRGTWSECRVIFRRVYWPRRHAQLWRSGTRIAKLGKVGFSAYVISKS